MPLFCYIHYGLYVVGPEGIEGCHEPTCVKFRDVDMSHVTMRDPAVPGGFVDSRENVQYDFHKNFDKGLDAYKKARDEGLEPKATTVAAVEASHREVRSQKRAIKQLKKWGADTSELSTAKGVE